MGRKRARFGWMTMVVLGGVGIVGGARPAQGVAGGGWRVAGMSRPLGWRLA